MPEISELEKGYLRYEALKEMLAISGFNHSFTKQGVRQVSLLFYTIDKDQYCQIMRPELAGEERIVLEIQTKRLKQGESVKNALDLLADDCIKKLEKEK